QVELAEAVAATEAADVDSGDAKSQLEELVAMVGKLRKATTALEHASDHDGGDVHAHAVHIRDKVKPALLKLREAADAIEEQVAADLWPMPTYREMLLVK
ncbi:MAG: glutamine synthetase type III, partial [Planctomycetota bacterium]